MKHSLIESLDDYDIVMLQALADGRGVELSSSHRSTVVKELADQLLSPTGLAITLAELSEPEREALAGLQLAGGWMENHRFSRQFGTVRDMGPGRLARERPWLEPSSVSESLWYKGLIFKGFRQGEAGPQEVIYSPADVLGHLPVPEARESVVGPVALAAPPAVIWVRTGLCEDVFETLTFCWNHRLRLDARGNLLARDRAALQSLIGQGRDRQESIADEYLLFVLHLCKSCGLLIESNRRLTLDREPVRLWLRSPAPARLLGLQKAWRDGPAWNDLWHVPSLKPQATGWKNDPLLTRRALGPILGRCEPGAWYGIQDLVAVVKSELPDFQRSGGDYNTWYVHNLEGQLLTGFEHWDAVEGALIRYLLVGPLHWLQLTELGCQQDGAQPSTFRISPAGFRFLREADLPEEPAEVESESPAGLTVGEDFAVRVGQSFQLYDRFQLARFSDLVSRDDEGFVYRVTPEGMGRARRQGISPSQIVAFLKRRATEEPPSEVLEAILQLRVPDSNPVRLEQAVLLQVERSEILDQLRADPDLAALLGEPVSTTSVLVPRSNVRELRRCLVEMGLLKR